MAPGTTMQAGGQQNGEFFHFIHAGIQPRCGRRGGCLIRLQRVWRLTLHLVLMARQHGSNGPYDSGPIFALASAQVVVSLPHASQSGVAASAFLSHERPCRHLLNVSIATRYGILLCGVPHDPGLIRTVCDQSRRIARGWLARGRRARRLGRKSGRDRRLNLCLYGRFSVLFGSEWCGRSGRSARYGVDGADQRQPAPQPASPIPPARA